ANTYQKIYNYKTDSTWLERDSLVRAMPRHEDKRGGAGTFSDAATGRFNEDQYDDVISIWSNGSGINIMLPQFDSTKAMWTNSIRDSINDGVQDDRIYTRTGNFDNDEFDEFIIAYLDAEDSVHLDLYDVDQELQPTLISEFCENSVLAKPAGIQFIRYFIESGDLNGDGMDELILFFVQQSWTAEYIPVTLKIYDFSTQAFESKADTVFPVYKLVSGSVLQDYLMAATTGNFKTDEKDEILFVANRKTPNPGRYAYSHVIEATDNLDSLIMGTRHLMSQTGNTFSELSLASGDLNNDGRDEAVFVSSNSYYILVTNDDLTNTDAYNGGVENGGSGDYTQSYNFVKIADTNQDGREDIIIVKNFVNTDYPDGFFVAIVPINDDFEPDDISYGGARLFGDESQNDTYHPFAIAVGNFDGFNFCIEQPVHSVVSDLVKPTVILKAPPVHFDMFGDEIYDLNECFNGGDCDFYATYLKESGTSVEVSTNVHGDYAFSTGLKIAGTVNASPMGVGMDLEFSAHALKTWGNSLSEDSTNTTIINVSYSIPAREDDRIYSTIVDYDVWEYPVHYGNESFPRRSFLIVLPKGVRGSWFGSKSFSALSYQPNNEVGNILSYQSYDSLQQNPDMDQAIWSDIADLSSFDVDATSSPDWYLDYQNFVNSSASTSRESGWDTGIFLPGFEFNFDSDNKTVNTRSTTVTDHINLHVHLGSVNTGIGEVGYSVTPYAYWGKNDALIVDYAVEPEIASAGFPETWWQQKYSDHSDPTFILPWRLDPEKGYSSSENAKRFQTKNMLFSPSSPAPGDTVTITTNVRNFSLMQTPLPVTVHFYYGDPDSGGTEIIGLEGTNSVSTAQIIPARARETVEFKWIFPSGLPSYPRIYAVLDEDDAISEIHETNNKGFNVLGAPALSTDIAENNANIPDVYRLYQSYPNPFNPLTNIKYVISRRDKVTLKVYDVLGRKVRTLVNKYQNAGTYIYQFDGGALASGTYFYDLKIGDSYAQTKKMLLIR
ncbi:MAG: T9SS type A sorting domain-containing protein, partial [Calditrichaceae bacterium]